MHTCHMPVCTYKYTNVACFNEYSCVYKDKHGAPLYSAFLYESKKFPGHYIRWYIGKNMVDCEVGHIIVPISMIVNC